MSDFLARLIKERPCGTLSKAILYCFAAIAMLLFGLFYCVGYDNVYENDARFNAPQFTDAIIIFCYLMLAIAFIVVVVSMAFAMRRRGTALRTTNGINATAIAVASVALLATVLGLTFACGSEEPMSINGKVYDDALWLRLADMMINTTLILTITAVLLIVLGKAVRNIRK